MSTKNELKRARTQAFAEQLIEHNPGTPLDVLQARVGILDEHDKLAGGMSSGRTLYRWRRGENGASSLEALQHAASLAAEHGLLPPLREGGLRRADLFGVEETLDRDKKYTAQCKRLDDVRKARERAVAALEAYAAALKALEEDAEILTIDASGDAPEEHPREVHHSHVDALAREIERHADVRLW